MKMAPIVSLIALTVLWSQLLFGVASASNSDADYILYPEPATSNTLHLGALFPIHGFRVGTDDSGEEVHVCGDNIKVDGLLALEAFLFVLDQINSNSSLLPGVTLGGIAMDSCDSPQIARNRSLAFIKGNLASQLELHHPDFVCPSRNETPVFKNKVYDRVVGVIGDMRSSISVEMAHMLKLFEIPQISFLSTSVSLSNNLDFPFFLRTVPPDNRQVEVILTLLKYLDWTYVSLVYSKDVYGKNGKDEFVQQAEHYDVCFRQPLHGLSYFDHDSRYREVAEELIHNDKAKVVVLFAEQSVASKLLTAVESTSHGHQHHSANRLVFIGSDGWTIPPIQKDLEHTVEDTIAVQPIHQTLPDFESHFLGLTPKTNVRNRVWFREFWEQQMGCSFTDSRPRKRCNDSYKINLTTFQWEFDWLHFLRDGVYAFAEALHTMWITHCGGKSGLCEGMVHNGHIHGKELLRQLKNVSFMDVSGERFQFDGNRSGLPRYTVLQYQRQGGSYHWAPIMNYTGTGSLDFGQDLKWHQSLTPTSKCRPQCQPGEVMEISQEDICCSTCRTCGGNEAYNSTLSQCVSCSECDYRPTNGSSCQPRPIKILDFSNPWAVTATVFSSLGILISLLVAIIFWMHLHTPVIKAASRELSFILLTGIILCFTMTYVIMVPPTPLSCGATRFLLGFSYTLCYAAILTKTNRIARLFKSPSRVLKTRFTSPASQLIIVSVLVAVEVIINIFWLMYKPPHAKPECPLDSPHKIIVCDGIKEYYYLIGLIYPLILVILCTIYAIKTRKCPGGFNEARYIAFANYTTCIVWVVFVPLYLTKVPHDGNRAVALAISLSLGGFVQLVCLFLPKVHLVLFKPEKNTRDAVMSQHAYTAGGGSRGSNSGRTARQGIHNLAAWNNDSHRSRSMPPPDITLYPYTSIPAQSNFDPLNTTAMRHSNIVGFDEVKHSPTSQNPPAFLQQIQQPETPSQSNNSNLRPSSQQHSNGPQPPHSGGSNSKGAAGDRHSDVDRVNDAPRTSTSYGRGGGQQKTQLLPARSDEAPPIDGRDNTGYSTLQRR